MNVFEEHSGVKGPPQATIARRAKSYSDFYDVAISFLSKEAKSKAPCDMLEPSQETEDAVSMTANYEDVEDALLDESQEEYQYICAHDLAWFSINSLPGFTEIS